ncbi:RNA methyltransferase [Paenibacillus sp. TRM 82003]|nr:RNA methyltransferase [Paenibacillus sp. TRM 82003]
MAIPETIRSLQNPLVKEWAALQTRKGREKAGAFLVEGAHLVGEALRRGEVTTVIYVPGSAAYEEIGESAQAAAQEHAKRVPVAEAVMDKITDADTPQGVAAIVRRRVVRPEDALAAVPQGVWVAVDAVQDPGNLGTIIRSADAAGAAGVLVGTGTVDVYNPKTIRSTMGSVFHIPVVPCDLANALPLARSHGIRIVGTSLAATKSCYEASLGASVCFLVGNEGAGVSPALQALANDAVIIPMAGGAESLNVAMATTILLFESMRQRLLHTTNKPTL